MRHYGKSAMVQFQHDRATAACFLFMRINGKPLYQKAITFAAMARSKTEIINNDNNNAAENVRSYKYYMILSKQEARIVSFQHRNLIIAVTNFA